MDVDYRFPNIFKKKLKLNLTYINASKKFISKIKNVNNPEKKRKIIGALFIKIFERFAKSKLLEYYLYPNCAYT